jgi:hypothetical protein
MNPILRFLASAGALAFGGVLGLYVAGPALGAGIVSPLDVSARAIPLNNADPAQDRVGRLRYMGGLILDARNMRFGGVSDMLWEPACNRILAITDSGSWIVLEPLEQDGRLTGISAAWIAALKGPDGNVPASKRAADAEGLTRLSDGSTWISYEQDHRLERFADVSACRPESLVSAPDRAVAPSEMAGWPENGGAEAIAAWQDQLLLIAEGAKGPGGSRLGLSGVPAQLGPGFVWVPPAGYEPTAMGKLGADGDDRYLVLHRRFTPLEGVSAILSEAEISAVSRGRIEGRELARLLPPLNVDNMEALAIREEGERRIVYLMSDNNFNVLQRTLLLKFELLPEPPQGQP